MLLRLDIKTRILSNILVQDVDGGGELVTKSITFAKAQNLVILVKGSNMVTAVATASTTSNSKAQSSQASESGLAPANLYRVNAANEVS